MTSLRNPRDAIAAMDFFVVRTLTFRVLYIWFAIQHGRRRIVHRQVTDHPDAAWGAQQLREAFPFDTAPRCPWQNGVAERWIGSVRRELLDHVVVFNDRHLLHL